jgi:hypothetical protein
MQVTQLESTVTQYVRLSFYGNTVLKVHNFLLPLTNI